MPNRQDNNGALQSAIAQLAEELDRADFALEDFVRLLEFSEETRTDGASSVEAGWTNACKPDNRNSDR
jgi:hypothetical protein